METHEKMATATLSETALEKLYQAARWGKFIAIIGFIGVGFLLLAAMFIGPIMSGLNDINQGLNDGFSESATLSSIPSTILAVVYGIMAVIYFFPVYYLFLFSNGIVTAYRKNDEEKLNASFSSLKNLYKFIGILLLVLLSFYVLIFVIAIIGAAIGLAVL